VSDTTGDAILINSSAHILRPTLRVSLQIYYAQPISTVIKMLTGVHYVLVFQERESFNKIVMRTDNTRMRVRI